MEQPTLSKNVSHRSLEPNPILAEHARRRAESFSEPRCRCHHGLRRIDVVRIHSHPLVRLLDRLRIEKYPYGLLTMIVSLEAIFLSTFVLISQNRANARHQVIANHQWRTVKQEDKQNEQLIKLSKQILELTRAIHNHTSSQAEAASSSSSNGSNNDQPL
jgi:hypothetical protein